MALYTAAAGGILRPEEVGALVVEPVARESVAFAVSTVVRTESHDFRIPRITSDASAAWTPEGSDITPSDLGVDELNLTPKKLAALTIISNELANDSSPAAQIVVGESIARDLARKIDSAYFGTTISNGPAGIDNLDNIQWVDNDGTFTNVDPFSEAISKLENVGATATSFVANASTVLALSKLKKLTTGSNEPLLQPDPTQPTRRTILGVPLISVPDTVVANNVVWAVDRSRSFVVLRQDVDLVVDASRYFESDRLGIRATLRVDFGWPHEEAVVKIASEPGT